MPDTPVTIYVCGCQRTTGAHTRPPTCGQHGTMRLVARKARWGWWVGGSWCPTPRIRDHWIRKRFPRV